MNFRNIYNLPTFLHLYKTTAQWIILAKLIELTFQLYVSLQTLIPTNIYFEVRDEKLYKIYIQNCKKCFKFQIFLKKL